MPAETSPAAGHTKKFKALPPNFETFESAKLARKQLVGWLHKQDDPAATALATVLEGCRKTNRCGSGACPVCNRAFRIRLGGEVKRVRPVAFEVLLISLIPESFRVESGGLADFDLRRWALSRHRAIERALPPESLFAGGVDVSLNTLENADPHWCFHLYGFVLLPLGWGVHNRSKVRRFRAELERRCPPVPKSHRVGAEKVLTVAAVDSQRFDDAVLYAHKGDFYRRSRYAYTKKKTGKRSTNVTPQTLPRSAKVELSLFLARFPLGSRLILVGFRRRGRRVDRFTLCRERDLPVVTI